MILVILTSVLMTFSASIAGGDYVSDLTANSFTYNTAYIYHSSSSAKITHTSNWDDFTCGDDPATLQGRISYNGTHDYANCEMSSEDGNQIISPPPTMFSCFSGDDETPSILIHALHNYNGNNDSGNAKIKTEWE